MSGSGDSGDELVCGAVRLRGCCSTWLDAGSRILVTATWVSKKPQGPYGLSNNPNVHSRASSWLFALFAMGDKTAGKMCAEVFRGLTCASLDIAAGWTLAFLAVSTPSRAKNRTSVVGLT